MESLKRICIFTFSRRTETCSSLSLLNKWELFSSISSAVQTWDISLFLPFLVSTISLKHPVFQTTSISITLCLSLSFCAAHLETEPGISVITTPVYTMHASSQQSGLDRCMGAWFCIHSVYCALCAPMGFIVCVCWSPCLSSSFAHTFADVFPDANIMAP